MTVAEGYEARLLNDLAADLGQLDGLAYADPGTDYDPADADIPVVRGRLPDSPSHVIGITGYGVDDDISLSDSTIGVQVRYRGTSDVDSVDSAASAVFDRWHGRKHWTTRTGIRVVQSWRQSVAPLGPDDSDRYERTDNYYLLVHRPSPNRT